MHIPLISSSTPMFLKYVDFASHRSVASELLASLSENFSTVENHFSALDFKKWRIVRTIGAFKSDDL